MLKSERHEMSPGFTSQLPSGGKAEKLTVKVSCCCFQIVMVSYEPTLEQVDSRVALEPSVVEARFLVLVQNTMLVPKMGSRSKVQG